MRIFLLSLSVACLLFSPLRSADDLPVKVPDLPVKTIAPRVPVTASNLRRATPTGDGKGLHLDLGDPALLGTFQLGLFPHAEGEADVPYSRYRFSGPIVNGQCDLPAAAFFPPAINVNGWPIGRGLIPPTMTLAVRLDLLKVSGGRAQVFGPLDARFSFQAPGGAVQPNLTIVEGPLVNLVESGDPGRVVVSWRTDLPAAARVRIVPADGPFKFGDAAPDPLAASARLVPSDGLATRHRLAVAGLRPATRYLYVAESETAGGEVARSGVISFRTAPAAGAGEVTFLAVSDSPSAAGGGERDSMGVNRQASQQLAMEAVRRGADLTIFGGDMVYGFTGDEEDYRAQLQAWKDTWTPFWCSHPVYAVPGNHETLANYYQDGSAYGLALDKWPYDLHSAEAVFADEFVTPDNGPDPSDSRLPAFKGSNYSFLYGPVMFVGLNDFYWWTTDDKIPLLGGSPEGYLMEEQLEWFEKVLGEAERSPRVKFVVVFMHEPAFPVGQFLSEKGLWWDGNNNVKAWIKQGDQVVPCGQGVIDVRNRFWGVMARGRKTAALVVGHQHCYSRLLIDQTTPVGLPDRDDQDGDGVLDRFSPNPGFRRPLWQIVAGSGGANYYNYEKPGNKPWVPVAISNQDSYCIFRTQGNGMSMTAYALNGQVLDHVEDLMAVKRAPR